MKCCDMTYAESVAESPLISIWRLLAVWLVSSGPMYPRFWPTGQSLRDLLADRHLVTGYDDEPVGQWADRMAIAFSGSGTADQTALSRVAQP